MVQGLGFLRFRVQGSELRVQGLGFRVQGLGFDRCPPPLFFLSGAGASAKRDLRRCTHAKLGGKHASVFT
jgi:hypothetical protein